MLGLQASSPKSQKTNESKREMIWLPTWIQDGHDSHTQSQLGFYFLCMTLGLCRE